MPSARHTCATPEWYTPAPYVEAARTTMGTIDLDPASCAEAHQTVRAARYYAYESEERNGLTQTWVGNVFINPPGGQVRTFWEKLVRAYMGGDPDFQAVWVGYSLEQLQTLQTLIPGGCGLTPLDFSLCVPRRRIAFVESVERAAARGEKRASGPSHANYITYIGCHTTRFEAVFSAFGQVMAPR